MGSRSRSWALPCGGSRYDGCDGPDRGVEVHAVAVGVVGQGGPYGIESDLAAATGVAVRP